MALAAGEAYETFGTKRMIARLLIALVRVYQKLISPLLPPSCRFEPSCSRYAVACLEAHGAVRGSLLSVKRLCKCHPFHPGGHDPPPPRTRKRTNKEEARDAS
jgi:uncharacterized protein